MMFSGGITEVPLVKVTPQHIRPALLTQIQKGAKVSRAVAVKALKFWKRSPT